MVISDLVLVTLPSFTSPLMRKKSTILLRMSWPGAGLRCALEASMELCAVTVGWMRMLLLSVLILDSQNMVCIEVKNGLSALPVNLFLRSYCCV